jgi:hypothetical protein
MATRTDNTSSLNITGAPGDVTRQVTIIQASTFNSMLNVLEALNNHGHTYYDDYTTVCECQCQCASNRGLL